MDAPRAVELSSPVQQLQLILEDDELHSLLVADR